MLGKVASYYTQQEQQQLVVQSFICVAEMGGPGNVNGFCYATNVRNITEMDTIRNKHIDKLI